MKTKPENSDDGGVLVKFDGTTLPPGYDAQQQVGRFVMPQPPGDDAQQQVGRFVMPQPPAIHGEIYL